MASLHPPPSFRSVESKQMDVVEVSAQGLEDMTHWMTQPALVIHPCFLELRAENITLALCQL